MTQPSSAKSSTVEYRLRWRREGRERTTRIYQTRKAAERKARGILALEEIKDDTSMAEMPDLVELPTLEERVVGAWGTSGTQLPPPTDEDREGMRMHFAPDYSDSYGPF